MKLSCRFKLILLTTFLNCFISISQEFEVQGIIRDHDLGNILESATIFVQNPSDSTLISYTLSDDKGAFSLPVETSLKSIRFLVSYNGYQTHEQKLRLGLDKIIDLGFIELKPYIFELQETEVIGEAPPILIKKDTLEFNANSFMKRLDATLEDLLENLPGVEVDPENGITVHGDKISSIMINGQHFFSKDTKIALKNLPAEIIDKIQIVDAKTDKESFAGAEAESQNKNINVKLKKNIGNIFGNLTIGAGNKTSVPTVSLGRENRYQLSGIGNYFKDNERLTVLAGGNNIDNPGFTYDDLSELSNNARNLAWRGNMRGISKSSDFGIAYANKIKKIKLNSEYFFSDIDVSNRDNTIRDYFLGNQNIITNTVSNQKNESRSNRLNLQLNFEIDSTLQLSVSPAFLKSSSLNLENKETGTYGKEDILTNNSSYNGKVDKDEENFTNDFSIVKKVGNEGDYFSFNLDNKSLKTNSIYDFSNRIEVFNGENSEVTETTQEVKVQSDFYDIDVGLEYNKRVSEKVQIRPEMNFHKESTVNKRFASQLDIESGSYDLLPELSSFLDRDFSSFNPSVDFLYFSNKVELRAGLGMIRSNLEILEHLNQNLSIDKSYSDPFLSALLSIKLNSREKVTFQFSNKVLLQSIDKYVPVYNVIDPANIVLGNIDLNRTYQNDITLSYDNYNSKSKVGFFLYGKVSQFNDGLSVITTIDENGIILTSYKNTSGNYDGNFRAYVSKHRFVDRSSTRYTLAFNSMWLRRNNISNGDDYRIDRWSLYSRFGLSHSINEIYNFETTYDLGYIITDYSNAFQDNNILTHELSFNSTITPIKNILFENDMMIKYRPDIGPGFKRTNVSWNVSLGYKFLKDKAAFKFRVFDLLNQNIESNRFTYDNYVQDTESSVLKRYFLFVFSYRLTKPTNKN